jgi:hypothetical protein
VKSDDFKEYVVSAIHVVKSDKTLASDRGKKTNIQKLPFDI